MRKNICKLGTIGWPNFKFFKYILLIVMWNSELQNVLLYDELVESFVQVYWRELIFLWFVDLVNTDSVALVNESIDLLKSSLEKTKDGFVRIRDITANAIDGPSSSGQAAKKGENLANSVRNVKDEAAIHMLLACKRNVILCDFFRTGMFSLSAHKQPSSEKQLGKSNEAVNSFSLYFFDLVFIFLSFL